MINEKCTPLNEKMHPPASPSGIKILYLDLSMGAAGDMLAAALLDLLSADEQERALSELNAAGIPKTEIKRNAVMKCGIKGLGFQVSINDIVEESEWHIHPHHDGHHGHHHSHQAHHHATLDTVHDIIAGLKLPEEVKKDITAVYQLLAEAEGTVHGVPVTEIHFHEVGNLDAVADIAAVCLLMHKLQPQRVLASPVHVGSGHVHCAHGILPVPAPATAELLKGIPIYSGEIQGELCTPTGAALIKHFVQEYAPMPPLRPEVYGYGMGHRDFEQVNCVRAMLGNECGQ